MKQDIGGPFLQMAVFCEKILQERDGVLSAIRIIDRFMHSISGSEAPEIMPPIKTEISILIGLKSGSASGKQELKITPRAPSGQELPGFSGPVVFEGAESGANIAVRYVFDAKEEGLYWFDVELDGKLLTKMPLSITYQRLQGTAPSSQPVQ